MNKLIMLLTSIILVLFLFILYTRKSNIVEGLDGSTSSSNNEALANLASVYNSGNASLNNLTVTDGLVVKGVISGDGGANLKDTAFWGAIAMKDNPIYLRGWNDASNGLLYDPASNKVELRTGTGGSLTTSSGGTKPVIQYDKDTVTINGNLVVNGSITAQNITSTQNVTSSGVLRVGGWTFNDDGWNSGANPRRASMAIRYDKTNVGLGDQIWLNSGDGMIDICSPRNCYGRR